jgi:carbon-monoxide dehydrogenase medium subunit
MYPPKFDYHRPSSVQEAVSLLQQNPEAKVLAGGHSLIPLMKMRLAAPAAVVDIGRIPELKGIEDRGDSLVIGAATTYHEIETSDLVKSKCSLLAEAASHIGDRQVRHRGTIGGNLTHADPASDLPATALALGATLHIAGPGGSRSVKAADFFLDLMTTDVHPDEILTAVEVPVLGGNTGSCYLKFEHPASGYAICGAAALVTLNSDGSCASARLCFNGVAARPQDASAVTGALVGTSLDDAAIDQAVDSHLAITDPMGDMFASEEYRLELAKAYGKQALKTARDRARG